MKILVLGGAGYIGSHTVYRLIESGNEVVVFDNLETGHIEAVHPKAKFYKGDLRNRSEIDSVFDKEKGIDAVIHFAANSLVGESMTNPLKYYDNNLNGTKVLLQSMVAHGIDKIVFSSTAATYGEPERTPILETAPTNAQTVISKTVFTGLLRALFFGRENSVNATSNGGAIANLKPDQIAKNPTTATQIVLTAVSIT